MRILALETTDLAGSVAALDGDKLLREEKLDASHRSARSLAPAVRALLAAVAWAPRDVELVAVTTGPGSFTGLRVGVTTAKVLAYAAGAAVLGVDTFDALAAIAPREASPLAIGVDAQRGQVVARRFVRGDEQLEPATAAELLDVDAWLGGLSPGTFVTGPALTRFASRVPRELRLLDPECWNPTAAAVGMVAARRHAAGQRDDLWSLLPHYSRRSAAEEKREQRQSGG